MSKKGGKKDTLSILKKEEDKIKKETKKAEEEENSEEEEVDKNQNEVKEQTIEKSDKPRNLKELFGSMGDTKVKPKKKEKDGKQKQKKYEEPGKLKFINSKGTGNYEKIDNDAKNKKNLVYKNAKGLDEAAKENQKVKHTKDYLEKDTEKQYTEYEKVEKPKFTSNIKDGEENFVELNKNEDVRKYFFIFILWF